MEPPGESRKLAAVLSADVVGYSRLMGQDEPGTVQTLTESRAVFRQLIERHHGRVVDMAGDSVLAVFGSVVEAVQCASEAQDALRLRNETLPPGRRMAFRIGVTLGDVLERPDGSVYGEGVNVAARLEALAEPGGINVSGLVYDQVVSRLPLAYDDLGERAVKNIARPVRVYRVRTQPARGPGPGARRWRLAVRSWPRRRVVVPVARVLLLLALAAALAMDWRTGWLRQADPLLASPKGPHIAVLPFANMSGDPKQDYFADGITEQIITQLTRFRDLVVIARNSTFLYKGRAADVREVGRTLGARFVLEGSVQRSPKAVRVTAQLLDATTGAHLWADTYQRDLTAADLLAVQDDITDQVVAAIASIQVGAIRRAPAEPARGTAPRTMAAYDCLLRIYRYLTIYTQEEHAQARDCLERAVAAEPNIADAWANLADLYLDEDRLGFNPRPGAVDRALEAARRAAELDPTSGVGHQILANIYFHRHELDLFFAEAGRAIALNPNNSDTLAGMGVRMAMSGHWARGLQLAHRALMLNPDGPGWFHSADFFWHYHRREYREAVAAAERFRARTPDYYRVHIFLAAGYGQLGESAKAREAVDRLLGLKPDVAVRKEFGTLNLPRDLTEHLIDGLRKAGLDIPPQ